MKKLTLLSISLCLTSGFAIADDTGWRVGAGAGLNSLTSTQNGTTTQEDGDVKSFDSEAGQSFVIEAGYDFNKIVGVKAAISKGTAESTSNKVTPDGTTYVDINDYESTTMTLSTDIGYTFETQHLDVKPYAEFGVAVNSTDISEIDYGVSPSGEIGETVTDSSTAGDTAGFAGVGVRTTFNNGIYADINALKYDADNSLDNEIQTRLTVGYKF